MVNADAFSLYQAIPITTNVHTSYRSKPSLQFFKSPPPPLSRCVLRAFRPWQGPRRRLPREVLAVSSALHRSHTGHRPLFGDRSRRRRPRLFGVSSRVSRRAVICMGCASFGSPSPGAASLRVMMIPLRGATLAATPSTRAASATSTACLPAREPRVAAALAA